MNKIGKGMIVCFLLVFMVCMKAEAAGIDMNGAEPIPYGSEITGTISAKGQKNWYRFTVSQIEGWQQITLVCKSMGQVSMEIYDANGAKQMDAWVNAGQQKSIVYSFNKGSDYYIMIYGNEYLNEIGDYVLSIIEIEDDVKDTMGTAKEIKLGKEAKGALQIPGDVDYFKFTTSAKDAWRQIRLINKEASHMSATLYDHNGLELYEGGANKNGAGFIRDKLDKKETYYIRISSETYESARTGDYQLLVSELEDKEGDSIDTAFSIAANKKYTKKLEVKEDKDFFKVKIPKSGSYTATLKNTSGSWVNFNLYDGDGVRIGGTNVYYQNTSGTIKKVLAKNKTYYLSVSGDEAGKYVISIEATRKNSAK